MKYLTIFTLGLLLSLYLPDQRGQLKVAVLPNLPPAQKNLDIALIKNFAHNLNYELRLITVETVDEIVNLLQKQKIHFTVIYNPLHQYENLRLTPFYQQLEYYLVHHENNKFIPKNINLLTEEHLIYSSQHSINSKILNQLKQQQPKLDWQTSNIAHEHLLAQLNEQHIVLTDSIQLGKIRHFYPQLSIAMTVSQQNVAWAFSRQTQDDSLYQAAVQFIEQSKYNGQLEKFKQYYYGELTQADDFNAFNINSFYQNLSQRLPLYRHWFEQSALKNDIDWRLIAAVGYEESLWNPQAVSKTGVRGLMMLTEDTATYLNIENREDPFQSIEGGARYLKILYSRLPDDIAEPDRTWFMLAAYNLGFGHVMDARQLTEKAGFNPNYWGVVKKYILLLSKRRWYKKTKYGKARGYEAVEYVRRIRRYYAMLKFVDQQAMPQQVIYLHNGYKSISYKPHILSW